jgi:hypothetical protein
MSEGFIFEVANSLLVLLRRKRIVAEERERALDALGRLLRWWTTKAAGSPLRRPPHSRSNTG